MTPVFPGSEAKIAARAHAARLMAIMSGRARETTPFNGSSEDRADARAAAVARAIAMAAPARVLSCMAEIGGPHISGRGRRYIIMQERGEATIQ